MSGGGSPSEGRAYHLPVDLLGSEDGDHPSDAQALRSAAVVAAESHFEDFAEQRRDTHPAMIGSWENAWAEFVPVLEFPAELRKIVYANAIESLSATFRQAVRHRWHFPDEPAALKVLCLVATTISQNRENMTGRIHGWNTSWTRSPSTTATA